MHLLQDIEISNFLNIKNAHLDNLSDLNIIIGPNNCGKTSILRGISILERINVGKYDKPFICTSCLSLYHSLGNLLSVKGFINDREKFLNQRLSEFSFIFDSTELGRLSPDLIHKKEINRNELLPPENEANLRGEIARLNLNKSASNIEDIKRLQSILHAVEEYEKPIILLKQIENSLKSDHIRFLFNEKFVDEYLKTIIMCPDSRLDTYKGLNVPDYIKSKNFPATEQTTMINFLKSFIDLRLVDMRQNMDLIRLVDNQRFDTTIAEQGSGIKSLICLVADILAGTHNKILLIDEPELGLNPAGKQALLKFLLEQCYSKQVFITTHDPTFVNPLLWGANGVSVYIYSIVDQKFVKVNLKESKEDPNTFAGYLPHTVSLKKLHLYVEGSLDVYIFQIFLQRYLKGICINWWEVMNNIGIYHLAGDFWRHLLSTIPEKPYFSAIILDGDKSKLARDIVDKYTESGKSNFGFYSSISDMRKLTWASRRPKVLPSPVYCLSKQNIEEYLEPKPLDKNNGPIVAENMSNVPEEIAELFYITLNLSEMSLKK